MRCEVPQGVDVGPDLSEVETLRVDVADLAELSRIDVLLHPPDGRVEQEDVTDHQRQVSARGTLDEIATFRARPRQRLLDQDVLAGIERPLREVVVAGDRRRQDDPVDRVVGEHRFEVGRGPDARVLTLELR